MICILALKKKSLYICSSFIFKIDDFGAGAEVGESGRTVNPLAKPEGVRFPPCPQNFVRTYRFKQKWVSPQTLQNQVEGEFEAYSNSYFG